VPLLYNQLVTIPCTYKLSWVFLLQDAHEITVSHPKYIYWKLLKQPKTLLEVTCYSIYIKLKDHDKLMTGYADIDSYRANRYHVLNLHDSEPCKVVPRHITSFKDYLVHFQCTLLHGNLTNTFL